MAKPKIMFMDKSPRRPPSCSLDTRSDAWLLYKLRGDAKAVARELGIPEHAIKNLHNRMKGPIMEAVVAKSRNLLDEVNAMIFGAVDNIKDKIKDMPLDQAIDVMMKLIDKKVILEKLANPALGTVGDGFQVNIVLGEEKRVPGHDLVLRMPPDVIADQHVERSGENGPTS